MARQGHKYAHRIQTMVTEQQYELLQDYAQEIKKPQASLPVVGGNHLVLPLLNGSLAEFATVRH